MLRNLHLDLDILFVADTVSVDLVDTLKFYKDSETSVFFLQYPIEIIGRMNCLVFCSYFCQLCWLKLNLLPKYASFDSRTNLNGIL